MTLLLEGQAPRRGEQHISTSTILAGVVLFTIFLTRVTALDYNTAFVDEAIYLSIGQRVLQGIFYDNALQWLFGSYLYPVTAALANYVFDTGLLGARILSAISSTVAAFSVFLLTRRIFHENAALLAMLLYGFTGVSVFVGSLATYDSLGIGFAAVAAAFLTYGLTETNTYSRRRYYVFSALFLTGSILSKYIALAFLGPVGLLMGLYLLRRQWTQFWELSVYFALPIALLLGSYVLIFFEQLSVFITEFGKHATDSTTRLALLDLISQSIRIPLILGVIGIVIILRQGSLQQRIALWMLFVAGLIIPANHLLAANMRSLDKSLVYALLFIAPLAGVGTWHLWQWFQRHVTDTVGQWLVFSFFAIYLLLAIQVWHDQAWGLQRSWPNSQPVLDFLAAVPVSQETHILAEGGAVYDYYLDWGRDTNLMNTWDLHFIYGDAAGEDAMALAVTERHFDYLIFDGYFTPDLNDRLKELAWESGYDLVFSEEVTVRSETEEYEIFFEVYAAHPEELAHLLETQEGGDE